MTAQQPITTGSTPTATPDAASIIAAQQPPQVQQPQVPPTVVIGGYPAPDPNATPGPGAPGFGGSGDQVGRQERDGRAGEPDLGPGTQGVLGTRYTATLTPRGKKFVSNSTDDGVTVKVTRAEARVLLAEKMIVAGGGTGGGQPTLVSFAPSQGIALTMLTVAGAGFGTRGANSRVQVGGIDATISDWTDSIVHAQAVRGANVNDTPYPVVLRNQAMQTLACGNFTFKAVA